MTSLRSTNHSLQILDHVQNDDGVVMCTVRQKTTNQYALQEYVLDLHCADPEPDASGSGWLIYIFTFLEILWSRFIVSGVLTYMICQGIYSRTENKWVRVLITLERTIECKLITSLWKRPSLLLRIWYSTRALFHISLCGQCAPHISSHLCLQCCGHRD